MSNRLIRNTAILAKLETTYGLDAIPTGAANAMLVSNLSYPNFNAQLVDRDNIRPYLGASEQLTGTRYIEMGFDIELVGSGSAGVAPAWGAPLRACGFAETLTATTRVDYTPISTAQESVTIYWYDDGLLHKATGVRGDATLKLTAGGRPVISFKFTGIYSTPTPAANPSVTLTAFKTPQVVIDANSGDVLWDATHTPTGAPALTGGTAYPSQGLEIAFGNTAPFTPLLGGETVDITARTITSKISLDISAAQEAAFMADVELATLSTLGLQHGTVVGNKVLVFAPAVQKTNPQKVEVNGKRLVSYDLRLVPVSGNDELRIVTSF